MFRGLNRLIVSIAFLAVFCSAQPPKGGDLTKPTLYVVRLRPFGHRVALGVPASHQ